MSSMLIVVDLTRSNADWFSYHSREDPEQIRAITKTEYLGIPITQYAYQREYGNWPDIIMAIHFDRVKDKVDVVNTSDEDVVVQLMKSFELAIKGFCQTVKHREDSPVTECRFVSKADHVELPTTLDWVAVIAPKKDPVV